MRLPGLTSWNVRCAATASLVALLASDPARAADDRDKRIVAVRVEKGPVVDGLLDDPAWISAAADDRFTQNFPDQGKPPSQRTELRVVYDDHALYVAVRCHDTDPAGIVEWLTRRDRETIADRVTVDVDSRHDHTSAYHFEVNVSGVLADGLRFNDGDYSTDWDGLWSAVTRRDPGGWSAEFEIPWRTLRFDGHSPVMGFEVRRYVERRREVDEWAYIPRTESAQVSRFGSLEGIAGLGPKRLVQIQPYGALGVAVRSNQGAAADNGVTVPFNLGIDAKIGLTSSLTLDATINPDFGQVEADQVVLNLSTFEVFYPEKRPFFLEGVDLFATPVQLFYTRRIGRAPSSLNLSGNDAATDTPLAGRIWGAAKLSGQIVPHLSIAALDAVTAEQTAVVQRQGSFVRERRQLDPLTNYAVVRLRTDWGSSFLGAMVTAVNRFEDAGAAASRPGDYCPGDETSPPPDFEPLVPGLDGRCSRDAYAGGLDARLQTGSGAWVLFAQALGSRVEGGPARRHPDGTRVGPGDSGYGVLLKGGKQGGSDHIRFGLRYEGYSPQLELSDAGYLRQANLHYIGANFNLRANQRYGHVLESDIDVFQQERLAWDGTLLDAGAGMGGWARFSNFWQMWLGGGWNFDRWDNRETRDGAITERKGGWWSELWLKTDERRAINAELNLHVHAVRRGYMTQDDLTIGVRPLPQIELQLIPRISWVWGEPRWAETDEGGRRLWFGDLSSQSFDVTVRGIYTFTPRLTFQLYGQVFVAAGRFTNWLTATIPEDAACPDGRNPCPRARIPHADFTPDAIGKGSSDDFAYGDININAVLRWEFLPGSTLIAVYSRAHGQTGFDPSLGVLAAPSLGRFSHGPAVDNLLVKLTYLWR